MKRTKFSIGLLALCGIFVAGQCAVSASAQTIQQRKYDQQSRIANGVRSGQLTHGETRRLEGREAHLNREERHMRAENGGRLTRGDRAQLNRQQNHISRSIYRDKHNDRVR